MSHSCPFPLNFNSILLFIFFILGWDSNPVEWFSYPKTWFYSCLYSQQGHQINCGHCSLRLASFLSKFFYKFAGIIKTQGNPVIGAKYASNYFRRGTSMFFYPKFYPQIYPKFCQKMKLSLNLNLDRVSSVNNLEKIKIWYAWKNCFHLSNFFSQFYPDFCSNFV